MSAVPSEPIRMSEQEYLEFERQSEFKHEYINDEVLAMAGASDEHNLILASLIIGIGSQLRSKKDCKIYPSDMRVQIGASYAYPDMIVVCGERQLAYSMFDTLTNPSLLIEIVSPSSATYDRGAKFEAYQKIASLREYILVDQTKARLERFVRLDSGLWTYLAIEGLEAILEIQSLGIKLPLAEIYAQVNFE